MTRIKFAGVAFGFGGGALVGKLPFRNGEEGQSFLNRIKEWIYPQKNHALKRHFWGKISFIFDFK